MAVLELTSSNFEEKVLNNKDLVMVDFWATWCGPCKMFSPVVDEVAEEVKEGLTVGKINIDEQPDLADRFRVMSIPTLMLFKNGKPVSTTVGVQSKKAVLELIQKLK